MTHTLAQLRQHVKDKLLGGRSLFENDDWIDLAINRAIEAAYPQWYTEKTATFAGAASTFEYAIATDAAAITKVEMKSTEGDYWPILQWEIAPPIAGGTTKAIRFYDNDHNGDTISYHYLCSPTTLASSSSSTPVNAEYIVNSAAVEVLFAVAQQESDPDSRDILLRERDKCEERAMYYRRNMAMRHPPTTVKSRRRSR